MALQPLDGPWPLLQFRNLFFSQSVGFLGRGIRPSQGRYLHTGQHKHRINAHNKYIHALSGIQTHDLSVRASEDSSCLRPRSRCDRRSSVYNPKTVRKTLNKIVHVSLITGNFGEALSACSHFGHSLTQVTDGGRGIVCVPGSYLAKDLPERNMFRNETCPEGRKTHFLSNSLLRKSCGFPDNLTKDMLHIGGP
jgi:hypothetical protein